MALMGWWPLNGNLNDYSGNNNNLSPYGDQSQIISEGRIGKCYEVPSNSSTARLSTDRRDFFGKDDCSMFCWCKVNIQNKQSMSGIISNHNHSTESGLGINITKFSETTFGITCSTGYVEGGRTFNTFQGKKVLYVDKWYHIGLTYAKNTKSLKLYVDGEIDGDFTIPTDKTMKIISDYFSLFAWSIGHLGNTDYRCASQLNDVRVYDHALNSEEIREIYKTKILHYKFFSGFEENTENLINFDSTFETHEIGSNAGFNNQLGTGSYIGVSTDKSKFGEKSLKAVCAANSNNRLYRTVQASMGRQYTVSAWVYSETPGQKINIELLSDNYNWLSFWGNSHNGTGWELLSTTTENLKEDCTIYYFFKMINMSTMYIDNIMIEPKTYGSNVFTRNKREMLVGDSSGYLNHGFTTIETSPIWNNDCSILCNENKAITTPVLLSSTLIQNDLSMSIRIKVLSEQDIGNGIVFGYGYYGGMGVALENSTEQGLRIGGYFRNKLGQNSTASHKIELNKGYLCTVVLNFTSNRFKVYLDEKLIADQAVKKDILSYPERDTRIRINERMYSGGNGPFLSFKNIQLSDARIYASALSQEDITELYYELWKPEHVNHVGTNISATKTIESVCKNISVKGKTYQNILNGGFEGNQQNLSNTKIKIIPSPTNPQYHIRSSITKGRMPLMKPNTQYTVIANVTKNTLSNMKYINIIDNYKAVYSETIAATVGKTGIYKGVINTTRWDNGTNALITLCFPREDATEVTGEIEVEYTIIEGNHINNNDLPNFIDNIESVGQLNRNLISNYSSFNKGGSSKGVFEKKQNGRGFKYSCNEAGSFIFSTNVLSDLIPEHEYTLIIDVVSSYKNFAIGFSPAIGVKSFIPEIGLNVITFKVPASSENAQSIWVGNTGVNINIGEVCEINDFCIIRNDYFNESIKIENVADISENKSVIRVKSNSNNLFDITDINKLKAYYGGNYDDSNKSFNDIYSIKDNAITAKGQGVSGYLIGYLLPITKPISLIVNANGQYHPYIYYSQYKNGKRIVDQKTNNYSFIHKDTINHMTDTIFIGFGNVMESNYSINNIQIEEVESENAVPTKYQPYQSDTEKILLSQPLRSLPNEKCDELINNVITRRVGKSIYDNTKEETISPYAAQPKDTNFMLFISKYASDANKEPRVGKLYCDRFPEVNYYQVMNAVPCTEGVFSEHTGSIACMYFFIKKYRLATNDVDGFKKWLQDNPTTIYYELATPITEELNQTIYLKSFDEVTNITTNNNIKGEISCKILSKVPKFKDM